jgi:hypothetical protein
LASAYMCLFPLGPVLALASFTGMHRFPIEFQAAKPERSTERHKAG